MIVYLQIYISVMPCIVYRFNMQKSKIILSLGQVFNRCIRLCLEIGVVISGCTWYLNDIHTRRRSEASNDARRCYQKAFQTMKLFYAGYLRHIMLKDPEHRVPVI